MSDWTTSTFDQLHSLGLSRREMQVLEAAFAERENGNFNSPEPPRMHRTHTRGRGEGWTRHRANY